MKMTDEELYEGFSKEQIECYKREAREMYDPKLVEESEKRISKMSKDQWSALKAEGGEVARLIAELIDKKPDDPEVQKLIARHHAWIERFYPASDEVYRGLGQLYAEHQEFRKFYDKIHSGLADFMRDAMAYYADHALTENRE